MGDEKGSSEKELSGAPLVESNAKSVSPSPPPRGKKDREKWNARLSQVGRGRRIWISRWGARAKVRAACDQVGAGHSGSDAGDAATRGSCAGFPFSPFTPPPALRNRGVITLSLARVVLIAMPTRGNEQFRFSSSRFVSFFVSFRGSPRTRFFRNRQKRKRKETKSWKNGAAAKKFNRVGMETKTFKMGCGIRKTASLQGPITWIIVLTSSLFCLL